MFNVESDIFKQELTSANNERADDPSDQYGIFISVFAAALGCSLIDLDQFCTQLLDLTAIRRSEWDEIKLSINSPKRNRTIAELGINCYHYTRFNEDDLRELCTKFFGRFPTDTYTFCKVKFSYEETLIIALHYMTSGTRYLEMKETYGGDHTRYTYMIHFFGNFLYHKYFHRICGRSMEYWAEHVAAFREAIWKYVCFNDDGEQDIDILLEIIRIFGFMDCLQSASCQPGSGPINRDDDRVEDRFAIQRSFFTQYGKMWGMKTQALHLPNGMVGNVYFTSVSQNDLGVVNMSGIQEELERILHHYQLPNNTLPALYCDEIYQNSTVLVKRNGRQNTFYDRLTAARIDIEHFFGSVMSFWKRLGTKHTWKLVQMKGQVRVQLFAIFFMTNCLSCFRGNKTGVKYGLNVPTLDQYLNDVDYSYDGDNADDFMMGHLRKER